MVAACADGGVLKIPTMSPPNGDVVLTDLGLPDIPDEVVVRALLTTATVRPCVIVTTGSAHRIWLCCSPPEPA